jgi:hypothetical protein
VRQDEFDLSGPIQLVQVDSRPPYAQRGKECRGSIARPFDQRGANISRLDSDPVQRVCNLPGASVQISEAGLLPALNERDAIPERVPRTSQQVGEARAKESAEVGIVDHLGGEGTRNDSARAASAPPIIAVANVPHIRFRMNLITFAPYGASLSAQRI